MKEPTLKKRTADIKNTGNNYSRKYLQLIIVQQFACEYIHTYDVHLKTFRYLELGTRTLGIGPYFYPFIREGEVYCKCIRLWSDLPEILKPTGELGDLCPFVEALRSAWRKWK
ncbi:hypothetical protein CAB17_10705 [Legionella sainthelensi]|uniref:Uncharacterized protein n=1 Tax=Legionella sainthelensi TaxID=28087 RepID=A0A2H5FLP9_9GAMM|nr:hypothetical protein CAB17_10705 [Legionella sainthelensi]